MASRRGAEARRRKDRNTELIACGADVSLRSNANDTLGCPPKVP